MGVFGFKHSKKTCRKMKKSHKGIARPKWIKDRIRKGLKGYKMTDKRKKNISIATKISMRRTKHHINKNRDDNTKRNIMYMSMSKHNSLHKRSYDYLVEIGLIRRYITWFKRRFRL